MRKVRAVLVIASVWAALWFVLGLVLGVVLMPWWASDVRPPPFIELPIMLAIWGAFSGAAFAILLIVTDRRGSLATLSGARFATWGGLGTVVLPLVLILVEADQRPWGRDDWVAFSIFVVCSALAGAACAAGTLALAKRAPV